MADRRLRASRGRSSRLGTHRRKRPVEATYQSPVRAAFVIVRRRPSLTACGFHFRRRGYALPQLASFAEKKPARGRSKTAPSAAGRSGGEPRSLSECSKDAILGAVGSGRQVKFVMDDRARRVAADRVDFLPMRVQCGAGRNLSRSSLSHALALSSALAMTNIGKAR